MKGHNDKRQLEMIRNAAGLETEEDPQTHSFSSKLGEVSISRVTDGGFMVQDERMGLFVMCKREHIEVERWPNCPEVPDVFDSTGAQLVFTGAGGLRVVLCDLSYDDAPRLAWFVGVELVEDDE